MHSTHFTYSELPEDGKLHRALNAITLNLLVIRVNIGFGMNIPASIIVYEAPTLYFHKIDRLIRATRCNEVYVALGFQELPQPEADYKNVGIQKIISTVGNVESGSTWTKKILEWLSNGIFSKMIQLKREVPSTGASPINLNGNMENHLVAASKISNLPISRICGQVARDFMKTKTDMGDSMNNQEAEEF